MATLLSLFSIRRVWIVADICTIIWFIITIATRNKTDNLIKRLIWLWTHDKEKYNYIINKLAEQDKILSKAQHINIKDNWNGNCTMIIEDIK